MKIKLFFCYILILWNNIMFAQVEVLQKEVILARPLELFLRLDGDLEIEVLHDMFLVYNSNFGWDTAVDSGIFIGASYDCYGFYTKYGKMIRKETRKPENSFELLIDVEKNHPNVYNLLKIKASRYWRKHSYVGFDKPTFELFKANINYILLGEEKIWIPNFSYRACKKQKDAYYVSFKIYAIVNVTAFEPVSENTANLWMGNLRNTTRHTGRY